MLYGQRVFSPCLVKLYLNICLKKRKLLFFFQYIINGRYFVTRTTGRRALIFLRGVGVTCGVYQFARGSKYWSNRTVGFNSDSRNDNNAV